MTDAPERPRARVSCTRCWREEPLSLELNVAAGGALADWHQTEAGWVCGHCWTELDRRDELGLCRLCGRGAHAEEGERGGEWRRPGEGGELICPECHFAGRDAVIVQALKESVRRWQQAGVLARYQALVDNGLERERRIVTAMLRQQVEREGVKPSEAEWAAMIAAAVEAARRRWPKPIGQN